MSVIIVNLVSMVHTKMCNLYKFKKERERENSEKQCNWRYKGIWNPLPSLASQGEVSLYWFIWTNRNSSCKFLVWRLLTSPVYFLSFNCLSSGPPSTPSLHVVCCIRKWDCLINLCFFDWGLWSNMIAFYPCPADDIYALVCPYSQFSPLLPFLLSSFLCCFWVTCQYLAVQPLPNFKFGKVHLISQWTRSSKT